MFIYLLAFFIGGVSGLRTMAPVAVISWSAYAGWLNLQDTWLAFLGFAITPYILSVLAILELIGDKLPSTPSRRVPMQFGARILMGALSGAALGATSESLPGGLLAGAIGAVVGTLGGSELRGRFARAFGKDLPIALGEDVIAIGSAILIVALIR